MSAEAMGSHYFISSAGDLLPRWRDAFPGAVGLPPGSPALNGSRPDVVWLRLPAGAPVADAFADLRARFGDVPVVALSDEPDDDEALACFAAAARGYCNAHAVSELLRQVAGVVEQGGLWIGESLMGRLLAGTARLPAPPAPSGWEGVLTERERQVARAVAAGASNKEIARQLGITERTVKAHTGAIFEKLAVRDRLQLSLLVLGRQAR